MILDETTLRKLNQLTLVASRVRTGAIKGERRSSRRGSSVEFADYRDYTPGDDLRRLDWNIYARLDRPFIKLFEEEEDLAVYVLVDGSRSMDWGEGDLHKFQYALRLAAGLGAITLASGDVLSVGVLQSGRVATEYGPARGQGVLPRFFGFLNGLGAGGETDLNASLRGFALKPRRSGLVILISDLLAPGGYETGLRPLLGRGHEVTLLHLLAPDELDPPFEVLEPSEWRGPATCNWWTSKPATSRMSRWMAGCETCIANGCGTGFTPTKRIAANRASVILA